MSQEPNRTFRTEAGFFSWWRWTAVVVVVLLITLRPFGNHNNFTWTLDALSLALVAAVIWGAWKSRVVVSDAGIRFESGLPVWLSWASRDWQVHWDDLLSAQLAGRKGPVLKLLIHSPRGKFGLNPAFWFPTAQDVITSRKLLQSVALGKEPRELLLGLPLPSELTRRGVKIESSGVLASNEFDLAKNVYSQRLLILTAILFSYFAVEAALNMQMYGAYTPWALIATAGLASLAFAAILLSNGGVPIPHTIAVTVLLTCAATLFTYQAILRLNQMLDGDNRPVSFTLQIDGTLKSDRSEVPDLPAGFFGNYEYWASQKRGSAHPFIFHNGLGFATLDMSEYRERLRTFYGRDPGYDKVNPLTMKSAPQPEAK